MIDPLISLAFSLQTNKGVFALLLGSGVSRSAEILTGWEIVLDLIRKLSHLEGEDCGNDPAEWYREKYKKEPDYSKLLDALTKSPGERQQLLRNYFEPDEEERERGAKLPKDAHRAIAKLVSHGYVRVIVTTNFDRLIETAIEDEGISPTVISTRDAIQGAVPLVHQECCIIKIHGDYRDIRIKNTPKELSKYDPQTRKLLDRILDEFGMIVCGWSADWDEALRSAFERCKNRRFSLYWAARGQLGGHAERIVKNRHGSVIPIEHADRFFTELAEKVLALEELQKPHPLSVAAAASTIKRLLAEDRHRIRLHDLVHEETERVYDALQPVFQSLLEQGDRQQKFSRALEEFAARIEIVRNMLLQIGYWGNSEHLRLAAYPIERLNCDPSEGQSGRHLTAALRSIPSLMLLYSTGLSAIANNNIQVLSAVLSLPQINVNGEKQSLLRRMEWPKLQDWFKLLSQHERSYFPASEWLFINCREILRHQIPSDSDYEQLFDRFELIRSVVYVELDTHGNYPDDVDAEQSAWGPPGRFVWKLTSRYGDQQSLFDELKVDVELADQISRTGLFSGKPKRFLTALELFERSALKMSVKCF